MHRSLRFLCLALLLPMVAAAAPQDHARRASPFEALRWKGAEPEVQVKEVWYRPVSIDGVAVDEILRFCEKRWPGKREKRFGEDLVEAMDGMGSAPPEEVDLVLVRLDDGEQVTLKAVAMSERNRNAIRDASAPRRASAPRAPALLPREAVLADLRGLQGRLEDQFAYLRWKGIDLGAALEELADQLEEDVSNAELAEHLQVLLARFGDGHAGVRSPHAVRASGYPPVLLVEAAGGVVAIRSDRSDFLDPERPFVVRLDGRTIHEWTELLRPWITDGSPQLVRTRALRGLRELATWRERLALPAAAVAVYELAAEPDAAEGADVTLDLASRRPTYGDWPRTGIRTLEGNVGYLRLARMDDEFVPELRRAMDESRDTAGLVVDVRGNGGGSRGLLLALAGYLIGPGEGPWVGNVAVYRRSARFDEDHLEARFMYRASDERWSDAQRRAIEKLTETFEPEWDPGAGFSEWHYLVLDRTGHADEYFYDRPVVVLCDADGFSATDIFLGALSGRPRVTLMGAASSGGSARSQSFTLPSSGIEVRCASMASFRPDGRLYDGRGVEVDVEVEAGVRDFLDSGTDERLAAAVAYVLGD